MSDQYFDSDEELEEFVKLAIKEELARRAKAEQEPKDFFDRRAAEYLNPEIKEQEEPEPETDAEQATRWMEMDRKPQVNTFGMPIETSDQVWEAVREASGRIYGEQQEKQRGIEDWLREAEEEIARNKRANGK